jgi:hypothetical protein
MTDYPNWFNISAKDNFEKFLTPLAGRPGLRFLQLGVYTGDASVWMQDNILTHQNTCFLFDIDTWQGSDEDAHKSMDFNEVYEFYKSRIKHRDPVFHYRMSTYDFFVKEKHRIEGPFDFIYIDADHTTVGVLLDAELAWHHLKPNGIMAFDDYTWGQELPTELAPSLGIDLFLSRHEEEYKVLVINSQVWIQKNDN